MEKNNFVLIYGMKCNNSNNKWFKTLKEIINIHLLEITLIAICYFFPQVCIS